MPDPSKHADHPARERTFWRYNKGHFEKTGGDRWVRKTKEATFDYVETERTREYIELYDKSRPFTVRLYEGHCDVKVKDLNKFEPRLDGHWEVQ